MSALPDPLDRIAARCGETAAARLAACYGGAAIKLPGHARQMPAWHPLVQRLGAPLVSDLLDLFGPGARLDIPRQRRLAGLADAKSGDLARAVGDEIRRGKRTRRRGR